MLTKGVRVSSLLVIYLVLFLFCQTVSANTYLNENSTWQSGLIASFWTSIALGDIDNDGDLDLAQIGCTGTTGGLTCNGYLSKIYINNGTSLAESTTWEQNLTAVNYGSIAFGDIDNDGDLDLALTGCNNGGGSAAACNKGELSFIYMNNGTSLVENSSLKGDLVNVWKSSLAFGDINNDGKLDLVLTGATNTTIISKVYINNGTGFAENSIWEQELTSIWDGAVALGDVNNDNKLDLILTGYDNTYEIARVYINNGSSLVENTTWQQNLLAVDSSAISLGDYNNNGWLDLTLIGHSTRDNHEIYNNTGSAFVLLQQAYGTDQSLLGIFEGTQGFGSYNNDGYLDLITSGEEQYTTLYLYNTSSLRFTPYLNDPETGIFNTAFGPSAAWGDLDNDNDLDLTLIGVDSSDIVHKAKIYINNITTKNTAPNPPTNFTSSYQNNRLTLTWNNASDNETPALGLYYNLKVGNSSNKHSIVSGVYGGGDDNGYFGNMMQRKSLTLKNLNFQPNQTIYWSVQTIDTTLKAGNWSVEQNYTLPLDITQPTITLNAPVDQFNTTNSIITFNATVYDNINLTNVSLYGNWSGWHSNETNSSGINNTNYIFTKNLTVFGDGTYQWRIEARDNSNNSINSSTRTFRIDTTYPFINLATPANASTWTPSQTVTFTYNVTDLALSNCSLILGGSIDQTDETVTVNSAQTFTKSLSNGDYNWSINCTDAVNYQNNSETRYLTVSYTPPSSSSSGGGGSSSGSGSAVAGTTTYVLTDKQFSDGYATELGKKDKVKFTVSGSEHYVTLDSLTSVAATINVTSKLQQAILLVGEEKKFEVSGDSNYDVSVKVGSINISAVKAKLTVKANSEQVPAIPKIIVKEKVIENDSTGIAENDTEKIAEKVTAVKEEVIPEKDTKWYLFSIAIIVIAGFSCLAYYKLRWKNAHKKRN